MTDRVFPSKPPVPGGGASTAAAANGGANPAFPTTKGQLFNAARQPYRPQPPPRRGSRRGLCCTCCLWTTLVILVLLLLAGLAGVAFYVIYRPDRPSFSVASLQLSRFNLTDTAVTSAFNVSLVARNRNGKISFFYDRISVKLLSGDVGVGDGSFPAFVQGKKNATTLRTVVSSSNAPIPAGTDISALKSSFRSRNLPLKIQFETKMSFKIGRSKTKKLKIRVTCDGIKISIPSGRTPSTATTSKVKCDIDPRIRIIRWTV